MNKYKLISFLIIFLLISSTPFIMISLVKGNSNSNVADIKYLEYQDKSQIMLCSNGNATANSKNILVYEKNFTSYFTLYFNGNNVSLKDTITGVNLTSLLYIIFSNSASYPSNPINNYTIEQCNFKRDINSPYNALFGYLDVAEKVYSINILDNNITTPNGSGHPVMGESTTRIYSAPLKNGNVMYSTSSGLFFDGINKLYKSSFQNKSYSLLYNLLGGTTILWDVASHSNNSANFELSVGSQISLKSTNIQFKPTLSYYVENGILTGSIFLIACALYYYGRNRKWKMYQALFLPVMATVVLSIFILPHTYVLYSI